MQMTKQFKERERFKKKQYKLADELSEELGLLKACVLCAVKIEGGNYVATGHHEIVTRAELPGPENWETLFALHNIAQACSPHHDQLNHLRSLWLHAMVALGLARAEQYEVEPFRAYWEEGDFPPPLKCFGHYGNGSRYFETNVMPGSLKRLYVVRNPDFDEHRFCEFCRLRLKCRVVIEYGTSASL